MDFYALQMTPRKKDEKKAKNKIEPHVFTKQELIDDLGKNRLGGFIGKMMQNAKQKPLAKEREEKQQAQTIVQSELTKVPDSVQFENHSQEFSPNFKKFYQKTKTTADKKQEVLAKKNSLDACQQELLDNLLIATRDFDENKLRESIEKISQFRSENENNFSKDAPLNVAIRKKLFESVSAQYAYNGIKNIDDIFKLLDLLGVEMCAQDFAQIPDEILKSEEMSAQAIKYLLWFAQEHEDSPIELEKQIACFASCEIIASDEIRELPKLREIIERNLLKFFKEHQKNPLEVERKIYEYALAGFVQAANFKQSQRVKDISRHFLFELIEKNLETIEHVEKKLAEFEHCGFVLRSELKNDAKIQKLIEKYLLHYIKANIAHPRKVKMRIEEYFKRGFISNQAREDFLKATK